VPRIAVTSLCSFEPELAFTFSNEFFLPSPHASRPVLTLASRPSWLFDDLNAFFLLTPHALRLTATSYSRLTPFFLLLPVPLTRNTDRN
jgi:hypothetical protein